MLLASALSSPASAAPAGKVPSQRVRNFIYVVPNGFGPASQTLWRDYINIINKNGTELRPNSTATELDRIVSAPPWKIVNGTGVEKNAHTGSR